MSSINKVVLSGRLTADPELKKAGNNSVVNFSIACDRNYKVNDSRPVDFINCEAWKSQAELIGKYSHKGDQIGVVGSIRVDAYDSDKGRRYKTYVKVDEVILFGGNSKTNDVSSDNVEPDVAETPTENQKSDDELPF